MGYPCSFGWIEREVLEKDEVLMKHVGREEAMPGLFARHTWSIWSAVGEKAVTSPRGGHSAECQCLQIWLEYTGLSGPERVAEQSIDLSKSGMKAESTCHTIDQAPLEVESQWVVGWDGWAVHRLLRLQSIICPPPTIQVSHADESEQTNTAHHQLSDPRPRQTIIRPKVRASLLHLQLLSEPWCSQKSTCVAHLQWHKIRVEKNRQLKW